MKKLLFAGALAVSGLVTPLFADYGCCAPQFDNCCQPQCCGSNFDGFYIGGNLGVVSHTAHRNDLDGFLTDNSGWSTVENDFTAGLQLGYDWNWCNSVLGVIVDWNWVNTDHKVRDNVNGGSDHKIRSNFDWFTTIRGRAGVTVCNALVYFTAGAAVARHEIKWIDGEDRFKNNRSDWGWVGGFGTEFMVGCNWSVGAELLFLSFSDRVRSFTVDTTTYAFGHSDTAWVARFLVNYRFGDLFSGCCW